MIGFPEEEDVGSALTSVIVGCGDGVIAIAVADSLAEEQAVNIKSPNKVFNRTFGIFFMSVIKNIIALNMK